MKLRKYLLALVVAAPVAAYASNSYELRVSVPGMKAPAPTVASPMFEFTTCGKNFQTGPSLSQCRSAYSGQSILDPVYNFSVSSGIQQWTVQETGKYRITAYGSWGGIPYDPGDPRVTDEMRGRGAMISGDFNLSAGDVVKVVVGQSGRNYKGNYANGGGVGGGGSFVWIDGQSQPLIAAGGGGGASIVNTKYDQSLVYGVGGDVGLDGTPANGTTMANFGVNGGSATYTKGARGWNSMISRMNFNGYYDSSYDRYSGFGGGGISVMTGPHGHGAGGGGGYSGGGSTKANSTDSSYGGNPDGRNGGGGGGSYNAGTNQDNQAGVNAGLGRVVIEKY